MYSKVKLIIAPILVFFALIMCASCSEGNNHPDLKLFHLNGKVKSLSYSIVSDNTNEYYRAGGALDIYYGEYYDYKFSKEGKWTNPKEMVDRNSDGSITKLGYREMSWDNKGYLTIRVDCYSYEDEFCSRIEYYYNDENVVDSLREVQPGADAEIIHRYKCEDFDEYGNWTYSEVEVVDISRENESLGEYTVRRKIEYWTEEELEEEELKEEGGSWFSNPIKDFKKTLNDDGCIYMFTLYKKYLDGGFFHGTIETSENDYHADCSEKIVIAFYPNKDDADSGDANIYRFDLDMKSYNRYVIRFDYIIEGERIKLYNGKTYNGIFADDEYTYYDDRYLTIDKKGDKVILKGVYSDIKRIWEQEELGVNKYKLK